MDDLSTLDCTTPQRAVKWLSEKTKWECDVVNTHGVYWMVSIIRGEREIYITSDDMRKAVVAAYNSWIGIRSER